MCCWHALLASTSASAHAPWSCRISARCTRHVEVKIIICRWSWHQRPSAAELLDALAAVDHAAVDETGHHRRELAGRDRDHRLVEKRESLLEAPHLEERPSLDVACGGDQVTLAEASAEAGRLVGARASALQLARLEMRLREGQERIPRFRRSLVPPGRAVADPARAIP